MRRLRLRGQRTGFGVFLLGTGMGLVTNLVTADPDGWPAGLRPVAEHASVIGVALVVAVGVRAGWDVWRAGIERPEWTGGNPYPGLEAYTESRAGVFFGRRPEVEELVTRVRQARAAAGRFVPVVGPSGSGKSSLVLAGLLPALRGSELRIVPPFSPGGNAVGELAAVLGVDLAEPARAVLAAARAGERPPRPPEVLGALAGLRAGARGLLLVVDQLEEAVTLCVEEDRQAFLALVEAMLEWEPRLRVVATVRSDTVGAFQHGPGRDLFRQPLMVNVLGAREIREIVREPARLTATEFDGGLIDEIVRDAAGGDALPLLSYLLSDLYRGAARDRRITWREYEAGGGVSGAITRQALAAVGEVSGVDALDACLDALLRFVTIGPGGATRQPVRSSSLSDRQRQVVRAFVDARLLTSDAGAEGDAVYRIVHEALLRQWQPLSEHIVRHEENLRRLTELVPMARAWQRSGRHTDYLISGTRLVDARGWAGDGHGLPPELREFLAESQRHQSGEMERRADRVAQEVVALLDAPETGIALALGAYTELAPTEQAARALELALADGLVRVLSHPAGVACLAFDRAGRLAAGRADGAVSVWPRTGPAEVLDDLGEPVSGVAFGPDGRLATAAMDGTVRTRDGAVRAVPGWGIVRLAAHEDGRWAIGAADGSVWTADPELRTAEALHLAATPAYAVIALPGGGTAAGFGDGSVLVWDRDGREVQRLCGHDDAVFAVAAGPDGRIAAGSRDGRILIWDAEGGVAGKVQEGGAVTAVQYTPDGELAYGLADGVVKVRAPDGTLRHLLTGHVDPISALACASDGRLAAGSPDGGVRIWDLGGRLVETAEPGTTAVAPDGVEIASSGGRTVIRSADREFDFANWSERTITAGAFAPDGQIATGAEDGLVMVWDSTGLLSYSLTGGGGPITALSFDARSRLSIRQRDAVRTWPCGTDPARLLQIAARQPRERAAMDQEGAP